MNPPLMNPLGTVLAGAASPSPGAESAPTVVDSPGSVAGTLFAGLLGEVLTLPEGDPAPGLAAVAELPAAADMATRFPADALASATPGDPAQLAAQVAASVQAAEELDADTLADLREAALEAAAEEALAAMTSLATTLPMAERPEAAAPMPLTGVALQTVAAQTVAIAASGRDDVALTDALAALDSGADPNALLATSSGAATPARPEPPSALQGPVALAAPRFAEDIGARVVWQAEQKIGEASIRIAPEGLGPVEIRLRLDGDRVDVGFLAPHGETRSALEGALPRLREMLNQQGLQLGQSFVGGGPGQGDGRQASGDQPSRPGWPEAWSDPAGEAATPPAMPEVQRWRPRSLVDAYA